MPSPVKTNDRQRASGEFNGAVHALRAFAATMVFAVHLLDGFNTHFFPAYQPLNAAMPYVKRFGTFGVELFFVISGYVIMNSVGKYGPLAAPGSHLSVIRFFHGTVFRVELDWPYPSGKIIDRISFAKSLRPRHLFWNAGSESECMESYF